MSDILLEVKDLHVTSISRKARSGRSMASAFNIERGKTLGIVGESGCGKSVTARSILNMVRPPGRILSGEIITTIQAGAAHQSGRARSRRRGDPAHPWGEIAMIFQEPMTSLSPVHTIGNQIIEAILLHLQCPRSKRATRAIELLAQVGHAPAGASARPLSSSAQRRDAPAGDDRDGAVLPSAAADRRRADDRAGRDDPGADSRPDARTSGEFGMAIMFITHDLGVVAEMADDVVVMYLGKVVEDADVDTIFYEPKHPYTQALLRSIPRHDQKLGRLETIEAMYRVRPISPRAALFHPRCPHYVAAKCGNPPFVEVSEHHWARCARVFEIRPELTQAAQVQ